MHIYKGIIHKKRWNISSCINKEEIRRVHSKESSKSEEKKLDDFTHMTCRVKAKEQQKWIYSDSRAKLSEDEDNWGSMNCNGGILALCWCVQYGDRCFKRCKTEVKHAVQTVNVTLIF